MKKRTLRRWIKKNPALCNALVSITDRKHSFQEIGKMVTNVSASPLSRSEYWDEIVRYGLTNECTFLEGNRMCGKEQYVFERLFFAFNDGTVEEVSPEWDGISYSDVSNKVADNNFDFLILIRESGISWWNYYDQEANNRAIKKIQIKLLFKN